MPLRGAIPDLSSEDVVFLLAGYILPAWIFSHQEAARHLNFDCSRRVVDEVEAAGARLVFMSTDQVFDGETGGYVETSRVHPLNLYGQLKAAMEEHVLSTKEGIVARTGWNVSWREGEHCPVLQCYETLLKPPARMAYDNILNVSDVNDTASALLALASERVPAHRIYHLVSAPEISRVEIASLIRAKSLWGDTMNFEVVPFKSIVYSEPRPTRAFLRTNHLSDLGVKFASPLDVISRKVGLIDQWRTRTGASLPRSTSTESSASKFFPNSHSSNKVHQ
jgi:dTDP-4-dehydrorhamnose reductase